MMRLAWLLALVCVALAGCSAPSRSVSVATTSSSSGIEGDLPGGVSSAAAERIFAQQHPELLADYGGLYENPTVLAYINRIGDRVRAHTPLSGSQLQYFVLNSGTPNAFAVAGGRLYLTRGLIALMSSDAELAAVLGHEMAHLVERHSLERYDIEVSAQQEGSEAANQRILGFSRQQELEADSVGLEFLAAAGYRTDAAAEILAKMQAMDLLATGDGFAGGLAFQETHPTFGARTLQLMQLIGTTDSAAPAAADGRDNYLSMIDGLPFGDTGASGFISGRRFINPQYNVAFTAPDGFQIGQSGGSAFGLGPNNATVIFRAFENTEPGTVSAYLDRRFADLDDQPAETQAINGMQTAMLAFRKPDGTESFQIAAMQLDPDTLAVVIMLGGPELLGADSPFLEAVRSVEPNPQGAVTPPEPGRIRVVTVAPGQTVASLAAQMGVSGDREGLFRVLNGLTSAEDVTPGQRVKLVQ